MKDKLPPLDELNRLVRNNTAFTSWDEYRRAMQPHGYDQVYTPTLRTDVGRGDEVQRLRRATQELGFKVWPDDPEVQQRRLAQELGRSAPESQKANKAVERGQQERLPSPHHMEEEDPSPKAEVRSGPGWTKSDILGSGASRAARLRRRMRSRTGPDL